MTTRGLLLRGAVALGAIAAYEGAMALRRLGDRLMLASMRRAAPVQPQPEAEPSILTPESWTHIWREQPEA